MSHAPDPTERGVLQWVRGSMDTITVEPAPSLDEVIRRRRRRRRSRVGATGLAVAVVAAGLAWAVINLAGLRARQPEVTSTGPGNQVTVVARIVVPSPGDVVAGAGSIWARSWDHQGTLWRIDPTTNRVIARIDPGIPGGGSLGMSFGAGALWLLNNDGTVVRVDPATNAVVARIPTTAGALSLFAGEARVWVSCCGPDTRPGRGALIGVDAATDRVAVRIPLAGHPGSLAGGYGAVWVLDDARNALLRVDPLTRAITVIDVAPQGVADVADGTGAMWVTARTGVLVKVDPRTNQVVDTVAVPGSQSGMTTTAGSVWINSGSLVRVDAVRDRVLETVPVFAPCDCNAGIAVMGPSIWVADPAHGTVVRLDATAASATGAPTASSTGIGSTVYLDPPQDTMSFAPPGDAQPQLTSSEALAAFEAVDTEFSLPADATSYLGFYTAAVGDGTYRYRDRLAWGYTWHECAQPRAEVSPGTTVSCTAWLFIDANSGEMLEATWQNGA